MVLVDGFFFSSRAINHIKRENLAGYLNFAFSVGMILMLSADLVENIRTSEELSYVTNQLHFDLIEKWEDDFCKKLLPSKSAAKMQSNDTNGQI